jgi:hypothetical protein
VRGVGQEEGVGGGEGGEGFGGVCELGWLV